MNILIACEESGTVRDAFIAKGHKAVSCDLKAARNGGPHYKGNIFDIINGRVTIEPYGHIDRWDMLIAHPPCTFLTVTANKWLKDQPARKSGALVGAERRDAQKDAIDFFMKLVRAPIDLICVENPVGVMSSVWRPPTQIIQPFYFGHNEPKKTCLWLKGLPRLNSPVIDGNTPLVIEPEYHTTKSGKRLPKWYFFADKTQDRAEIRSKTFPGIADVMAESWGNVKYRPGATGWR